MNVNAWTQEVKDFEFEYTDARGILWEVSADFGYEPASEKDGDDFKLDGISQIRARRDDGPYIEVAADDGMIKQLKKEIDGNREIYEAEQEAVAEGRDEYVPEHDER